MKTIKCDKCGTEISKHPLQQAYFPSITIYVNEELGFREIDLCSGCEKDFYKWLIGVDKCSSK
jgi:predicted amidophosphoribosyltransferase